MAKSEKLNHLLKTLGPGIMFAGTCIGGSHLVQSTRAGADYGFDLLYIILLANFFKYPFFEFASRYTSATGDSVLEGYKKIGDWTLYLYGGITLVSMFIVTAAILSVTGGLLGNLFQASSESTTSWIIGISLVVLLLLAIGKFSILDSSLKIIGVALFLSVVGATAMILVKGKPEMVEGFVAPSIYNAAGFSFMIALMGWMPMGVDMSAWASLWTQERIKQTKYHPTLKETLLDFNIGYGVTVFTALCFLTLGAYVFYGTGEQLSNNATVFSNQLVTLFTSNIGAWSYTIIAVAVFSTMFGTSLTLVDGYTRSVVRIIDLLKESKIPDSKKNYLLWVIITISGGILIILGSTMETKAGQPILNFKQLIDVATAMSFLVAPVAAWLNYAVIYKTGLSESHKPKKWLHVLAILGMIFLAVFSISFIYSKFS